jgi:hypothetical protein
VLVEVHLLTSQLTILLLHAIVMTYYNIGVLCTRHHCISIRDMCLFASIANSVSVLAVVDAKSFITSAKLSHVHNNVCE